MSSHGYDHALKSGSDPSIELRGRGNVIAPCPTAVPTSVAIVDALILVAINVSGK